MPPRLVNALQLAEHLDATEKAVKQWARHGLIPSVKVSNQYFFNLQSVVKSLAQRETAAPEREVATCS